MANYYTMRFNPMLWPPPHGEVPAGVELSLKELAEQGLLCCAAAEMDRRETALLEERWVYRMTCRLNCSEHGETTLELDRRLDWISPNEYLLF